MYTTSTVLADAEKGTTVTTAVTLVEARALLGENVETVGQFTLYLIRGDLVPNLVEIAIAEDTLPPSDKKERADEIYNALAVMSMINPYNNDPEFGIDRIASSADALELLVKYARRLGEAVLPELHIPSDELVHAAKIVLHDLQAVKV